MKHARRIALCLIAGCLLQFGVAYGLWWRYVEHGSPSLPPFAYDSSPCAGETREARDFDVVDPTGTERTTFEVWAFHREVRFGVRVSGGIAYYEADQLDHSREVNQRIRASEATRSRDEWINSSWARVLPAFHERFARVHTGFPFSALTRYQVEPAELRVHGRRGANTRFVSRTKRLRDPTLDGAALLPEWVWYDPNRAVDHTRWPGVPRWAPPRNGLPVPSLPTPGFPPMWIDVPGAMGNTLVYAALMYTAFIGAGALRQRSRRRRGLCTSCKYQLD
ncbi:MAG: hypothetical protein AAGH64_10300, partial [Planctomycetota bacterium]